MNVSRSAIRLVLHPADRQRLAHRAQVVTRLALRQPRAQRAHGSMFVVEVERGVAVAALDLDSQLAGQTSRDELGELLDLDDRHDVGAAHQIASRSRTRTMSAATSG